MLRDIAICALPKCRESQTDPHRREDTYESCGYRPGRVRTLDGGCVENLTCVCSLFARAVSIAPVRDPAEAA
jgi:hypothetical protein